MEAAEEIVRIAEDLDDEHEFSEQEENDEADLNVNIDLIDDRLLEDPQLAAERDAKPEEETFEDDEHIYVPARQCSKHCVLPNNWASKLVDSLIPLAKADSDELFNHIQSIEACQYCSTIRGCVNLDDCENVLRILLDISVHGSNLRTIRRRYYDIRRLARWIKLYNLAVHQGSMAELIEVCTKEPVARQFNRGDISELFSQADGLSIHHQTQLTAMYGDQIERCRRAFNEHEVFGCYSCYMLFRENQVIFFKISPFVRYYFILFLR